MTVGVHEAEAVSVPADVFSTLTRTGAIRDTDIIGEQTYVLADGSEANAMTFTIRSLKIGNKVVENVRGSVASARRHRPGRLVAVKAAGQLRSRRVDTHPPVVRQQRLPPSPPA